MSNLVPSYRQLNGFSLVEMSIVMILVGLLIGGILAAQTLIHGAQARSIISQITGYNAEVNTFQLKYGGMPGYLTNASTIVSGATTNGNGDGLIGWMTGNFGYAGPATPASGASYSNNAQYVLNTTLNSVDISYEYSAFWQHLTADQLISGKYTLTNTTLAVNTNMPYTKTNKNIGILAYANSGDNFNYYQLGVTNITLNTVCPITQNFLSPADAFLIDSKIDDGLPASGIVAARGINSDVALLTIDFTASYTGSATISSSLTNSCVVGTSYAASTAYNTAASVSSQLCQLRIKMN